MAISFLSESNLPINSWILILVDLNIFLARLKFKSTLYSRKTKTEER